MSRAAPHVHLAFVVHNHQPVGNFDDVMADAHANAYAPFLEVLSRYPEMPIGLHTSGALFDWLIDHRPEYLESLRRLVARGQVEMLTGGYYEPILCALADEDKIGQIAKQTEFLADRLDAVGRGLWLTERVWEPGLVRPLANAGVEYTIVDDSHFLSAGFPRQQLHGYYLTEDQGERLAVFPIDKRMRYLVPFEEPADTIDYLRQIAEQQPGSLVVLADDGEKFGVWPGTHKRSYEERWLERWIELLLAESDWLTLTTCDAYRRTAPPLGVAYLPTAAYAEMLEWALPTSAQAQLVELHEQLKEDGQEEAAQQFLRGGFWRHFMVKYPEANHMHKRVQAVAARARRHAAGGDRQPLEHAWAAQCNCAYWHGVFGGLYLPHLRDAIYGHLIDAERQLDTAELDAGLVHAEQVDVDLDGHDEWRVGTDAMVAIIAPRRGGGLLELDDRRTGANLVNTLARREEPFHAELRATAATVDSETSPVDDDSIESIHGELKVKESGLEQLLHYDDQRRLAGVEMLLPADATLEQVATNQVTPLCRWDALEVAAAAMDAGVWRLELTGRAGAPPARLHKVWRIHPDGRIELDLEVRHEGNAGRLAGLLVSEWNFAMLAGRAPDRYYDLPELDGDDRQLASQGVTGTVGRVGLIDDWRDLAVELAFDVPAPVWRYPVETVSLSEGGAERVYQCSAVLVCWPVDLAPGEAARRRLHLQMVPASAGVRV